MAMVEYQDLPLAGRDRRWDGDAAEKRVRAWAGAEDKPNERFRKAFLWYDEKAPDKFGSYKLPIADVIRGQLKAVPRAIIAAAAVIDGARGGAKIPPDDIPGIKANLARYYEKMGEQPPWETKGEKKKAS
ncbi:MAG: hypothetical protein QOH66_2336 [Actinomycetota bacterium]|jgi:hypothetical protein|nr:hypothetical protein [Actinomycetota bacterium]